MMYSIMPAANGPIKCYCSSERYLALAMKTLSLRDGYLVQRVPWRQSVNARNRRFEKPIYEER
jgi:hypothetical protein